MAPRLLPRVALGLIGMAVTQAICAAPQVDQAGRSRAALAAEWLQQCLDTDSHLVSIEEGLAPGGSLQRSLASSPLATRSATSLAQRMQQCSAKSAAAHSCALPGSLRQPLAIEVVEGEAHPAWSANDRARVADLVPAVLARLGESNARVTVAEGVQRSEARLRLSARIDYAGSGVSQRFTDQWLVTPRALHVELTLTDRSTRTTVAKRDLRVSLPWGVRPRHAETATATWLNRTLDAVDTGAREMLSSLECAPDVLTASRAPTGTWQLDVAGREGLEKGRLVLLVPADDTSLATHWPLARVVSVSGTRSADLEFVRGDESACGVDGCTAVVL